MNDTVLSIMVLGVAAMIVGAVLAYRRGDRRRAVLMAILAAVIAANVAILAMPIPESGTEAPTEAG